MSLGCKRHFQSHWILLIYNSRSLNTVQIQIKVIDYNSDTTQGHCILLRYKLRSLITTQIQLKVIECHLYDCKVHSRLLKCDHGYNVVNWQFLSLFDRLKELKAGKFCRWLSDVHLVNKRLQDAVLRNMMHIERILYINISSWKLHPKSCEYCVTNDLDVIQTNI